MNSDLLIHTLSYTPTSTCDVRDYHWTITPNLFPTTDHSLPAKTSFLKTTTTMAAATSVILSPKIDSSQKQASIYSLYAADVAAGLGSSFLVSPSITILDRAISMNASGAMKTVDSIREGVKEMILRPHVFHRRPE
ncbi:unnamed protein product, partial [Ascophyllum nodosum]